MLVAVFLNLSLFEIIWCLGVMLLFPSPWSFSWSFVFVFPTCFNFWNIVGCFCSTDLDNKIFVQSNGTIKIIANGAGDDLGLRDVKLWSLDARIQMPDLWSLACATVTLQLQSIQDDVLIHRVLTHLLKFQRCVSPVQVVFSNVFSAAFVGHQRCYHQGGPSSRLEKLLHHLWFC